MIGVAARADEEGAAREFFELFKTPWEFYQENATYEVIIDTVGETALSCNAGTIIVFSSDITPFDDKKRCIINKGEQTLLSTPEGEELPLFGKLLCFDEAEHPLLYTEEDRRIAGYARRNGTSSLLRVGYDLFQEVRHVLTLWQEKKFSRFPTLDLHIFLLRNWILKSGVPVIEIPPKPPGFAFIVCLTHDVDFYAIRKHFLDHTFWGFLYRGWFMTLMDFLRGRVPLDRAIANWMAVLLLPFVYLGLVRDYWIQFHRYRAIEKDLYATFFVVPFKNRTGIGFAGAGRRATRYDIDDIESEIPPLLSSGFEIAVHGIDSWCDPDRGRLEREKVSRVTGQEETGLRVHWLCLNELSFHCFEKSGYSYDSSLGYNDAAGFRGGTAQAFRPLGVEKLLELPLNIQDTALFYPDRMNLDEEKARDVVDDLVKTVRKTGGVLTVNWHHRSLAPERLWGKFYLDLLNLLKEEKPWFATARQAVHWFQKRRSVKFGTVTTSSSGLTLNVSVKGNRNGPDLLLRVHMPENDGEKDFFRMACGRSRCVEISFSGSGELTLSLTTRQTS